MSLAHGILGWFFESEAVTDTFVRRHVGYLTIETGTMITMYPDADDTRRSSESTLLGGLCHIVDFVKPECCVSR